MTKLFSVIKTTEVCEMLNDLYTLEISHMINLCKYIAVNVLQTEKTFFCIYRTQKMPKTVMEKLKDMVTFSLII